MARACSDACSFCASIINRVKHYIIDAPLRFRFRRQVLGVFHVAVTRRSMTSSRPGIFGVARWYSLSRVARSGFSRSETAMSAAASTGAIESNVIWVREWKSSRVGSVLRRMRRQQFKDPLGHGQSSRDRASSAGIERPRCSAAARSPPPFGVTAHRVGIVQPPQLSMRLPADSGGTDRPAREPLRACSWERRSGSSPPRNFQRFGAHLHDAIQFIDRVRPDPRDAPAGEPAGGAGIAIRNENDSFVARFLRIALRAACSFAGGELRVAVTDGDLVPFADAGRVGVAEIDIAGGIDFARRAAGNPSPRRDRACWPRSCVPGPACGRLHARPTAEDAPAPSAPCGIDRLAFFIFGDQALRDQKILAHAHGPERNLAFDDLAGAGSTIASPYDQPRVERWTHSIML